MNRSINRIKKIGLDHLVRKKQKIERRMSKLLEEYYATEAAISYFVKENPQEASILKQGEANAIHSDGQTKGTDDGAAAGEGSGGNELSVLPSVPETLAEAGTPTVSDNPQA